ncbi:MAG: MlaD family protein [Pseudomonadota bacterium]
MESKVNYAAVGAFVIALGAVLIAVVLWLASGGAFQKKYDTYLAKVNESVSGLNPNAPVKFNGVDIGKVRAIQLDRSNPSQVLLTFSIEQGAPIKTDTVAVLNTQGLTGIAYVELTGGSASAPLLSSTVADEYPVIQTKPSLSTRLENMLSTVLTSVDHTTANLNAVLSKENSENFRNMLNDMAAVTHTVAARRHTLDAGIASAARTFDNSARLTAEARPVVARIGRSADALEIMAQQAGQASANAGRTVDAVGEDVQRFTTETLPEVERLMGETSVLVSSLRRLTEQTERNPASLLFGHQPVPLGPGESSSK